MAKNKPKPKAKTKPRAKKQEITIVKRLGHREVYDQRKVYGSCYFACRNAHLSEIESEVISNIVTKEVTKLIIKKNTTTSDEIFKLIALELNKYNEDAAFLYETHRDIS